MPATAAKTKKPDALPEVFAALKKIYAPYVKRLHVAVDTEACFYLETKGAAYRGKPMCVGAVRMGKSRVSFHLMALYCFPEMKKSMSAELNRRMQGKQCFNFAKQDAALFAELAELVAEGMRQFAAIKDFETHFVGRTCED